MHGGWFLAMYINLQWMQMGLERYLWTNTTYGYKKSKKKRIFLAFRARSAILGNGQHAAPFKMLAF